MKHWISYGVATLGLAAAACGGGEASPLAPSQGVNEPPSVMDIVSTPATVPFGGSSEVRVVAEDPNGDPLVYEYTALRGNLTGQGATVTYTNDGDTTATNDTIRVSIRDSRGAVTISALGLGLGRNPPPYGQNPFPRTDPSPSPTPRSSPTPGPGSTPRPPKPSPTPAPPANHPPSVSIGGASSCHPSPNTPCTVNLTANASDADGDSLQYSWSGCASGTTPSASCAVSSLGSFTASVTATDGRGGLASASHTAQGINDVPSVTLQNEPSSAVACGTQFVLAFSVADDQSSGSCSVSQVSGRCALKKKDCGDDGFTVTVTTTTAHNGGSCVVKGAAWSDPWGTSASEAARFDVQPCP